MDTNSIYELINKEKDICEKDIFSLINKAKTYHVNNVDISKFYDLENDYNRFKLDDSTQRYNLNKEIIDYKLSLLHQFINDLEEEKKFLDYKVEKEHALNEREYNEYLTNVVARTDYINKWYNEYINK